MAAEKTVTFTGDIVRTVYDSDTFAVYALNVPEDVVAGKHLKRSKFGNVSVCGNISGLQEGVMYDFIAVEKQTKHGYSYEVRKCTGSAETSENNTILFLTSILTENQAFELLKTYPDIVNMIIQGRDSEVDLSKLHGIGDYTFDLIKKKIIQNHDNIDLLSFFGGAVSLKTIAKIREKYPSIESVKKLFKKDPYGFLTDFQGIAFLKADKILLDMQKEQNLFDFDLKTSPQRCLAYIKFKLDSMADEEGSTKYDLIKLKEDVDKMVPSCAKHFTDCIKNEQIWYNAEELSVSMKYIRNMEEYCAEAIFEGLDNPVVWDIDVEKYKKVDEFELTNEQVVALGKLCKNNVAVLNGPAGCVDCDTEFFTGTEWKRIADYQDGDMVLQYNEDGTANLVFPERYIKQKADYLWRFHHKNGIDQCLSLNHNCYYAKQNKREFKTEPFYKIKEKNEKNVAGFGGRFLTTFSYSGRGIELSEFEIRLMVAVFADGCYINNPKNNYVRVRVQKERKFKRLIWILENLGSHYVHWVQKDNFHNGESYNVCFHTPINAKHYPKSWYNCSLEQLKIISEECLYWDGTFSSSEKYFTTNKDDADFIQFVFTSCGSRSSIYEDTRFIGEHKTYKGYSFTKRKVVYTVRKTKSSLVSISGCLREKEPNRKKGKTEIERYKTVDGYEYCFTVPSHLLVLRRNDNIFITGNCGKSQTLLSVIKMLEDNDKTYALMTPTARSAKVVRQYTNRPASTIHRGYMYSPSNGWQINTDNKLDVDVLILDESSMIGVSLMYHVLQGLDLTRTKLLLVGDSAQLSSVDAGNVLHDIINSGAVPVTSLTKIFRYQDGGLTKVATDIRMCKNYLPKDAGQHKTLNYGADRDYSFVTCTDDNVVKETTILYQRMLESGKQMDDIQVITAYNVGSTGTQAINKSIQRAINKNVGKNRKIVFGDITFYEDDLVIQKKNNYHTAVYDRETGKTTGDERLVCNGDVGRIVEINDGKSAIIKFDDMYYKYQKSEFTDVKLGYAISVHSSQGSQSDIVIFATPKNQMFMMSSNLLYVGCTRSKKRCIQIGDPYMVMSALRKKDERHRNTFLCDFLRNNNRALVDRAS